MGFGTINVRLRPIKLAFLVNPKDKVSLLKAIEINTFLWGGIYNPIIPTYNRIPAGWENGPFKTRNLNARSVISGYLDNFDPDYVVPMGECSAYSLDVGHREKIDDVSEILAPVEKDGIPKYGIGLFEVMKYFINRELKFQRRHPLEIGIPRFGSHFRPFLASVFGILPENIERIFWEHFANVLEAKKIDLSASNYGDFFDRQYFFILLINCLELTNVSYRRKCIFLLDATKPLDIMDYWNLRAIGWDVIPVPKQFLQFDKTKRLVLDLIGSNFAARSSKRAILHDSTLKSRSISEDEQQHFWDTLATYVSDDTNEASNIDVPSYPYPRIWDERTMIRDSDDVECRDFEADTADYDISTNQETIRFKTLDPKFINRFGGHGEARFANQIVLRLYGDTNLLAEVIPEGGWELARVIGGFDLFDWRLSRKGLVYLSRNSERTIELSLPQAEAIVTKWLESRGWRVELSPAGRIAKQMIRQFGGKNSTMILARKGILQLLREFNSSHEKSMTEADLRGRIAKIANQTMRETANQTKHMRDENAKRLQAAILQNLTDAKVFQLGVEIQCSICTQSSWYSVKDADYTLQCPKCLDLIAFPSESKEVKWSYRTLGPFSLPKQAHGAYTVILTLRFFSDFGLLGGATTPMMSFKANKDGTEMEADLALFFQASIFGDSKMEVIFAECKTYNSFQKKDVNRMAKLGRAFPGTVLVFATLKEFLSEKEKTILCRLVDRSRKRRKNHHTFNHVLVLTGIDLFLDSFRRSHLEKYSSRRDLFEFCDFTQQINLGMDSWHQWLDEQSGHTTTPMPTTWISKDGKIVAG